MAKRTPSKISPRDSDRSEPSQGLVPATSPELDGAVSSVVSGLPSFSANTEEIRSFLTTSISTALARREVPKDEIRWPRNDVVVPAIEALRYSPIKDAFASLIAASMDGRTAHAILPAYVEILKQISEDELVILRKAPAIGRFTPVADVVYVLPNEQIVSAYRNVVVADLADACVFRRNIPQYMDNLARLNLLYRPTGQQAADIAYRPFLKLPFVRTLMKDAPQRAQSGMDKAVCGLTDLGDNFRRACLS